jgi:hypothetical protein
MRPYDFICSYVVTDSRKSSIPIPQPVGASSDIPLETEGLKEIMEVEDIQVDEEETEEELLAIIQGKVVPECGPSDEDPVVA